MELKFIFSLFVLLHLKTCVSRSSNPVELCMKSLTSQYKPYNIRRCMNWILAYPEAAKNFADQDAMQEDLGVAIEYITKAFWNSKLPNSKLLNQVEVESFIPFITSGLTQCFKIRNVIFFLNTSTTAHCNLTFILFFRLSRIHTSYEDIKYSRSLGTLFKFGIVPGSLVYNGSLLSLA